MKASVSLLVALLTLGSMLALSATRAAPRRVAQQHTVYLPLAAGNSSPTAPPRPSQPPAPTQPPAPSPPAGTVPPELAGRWFKGALLPRSVYDPATGTWGSANGLGQVYEFMPDGSFTYTAVFRVENPGCASEVTVYRQGTADAAGATLTLRPTTAKTRTTICGQPPTVSDGPYDAQTIPWSAGSDERGRPALMLTVDGTSETFNKYGVPDVIVGTWHSGEIRAAGFYDPATGVFTTATGQGWWISLAADGTYRWGQHVHGTDTEGCALAGWLYLEGTLTVAGAQITFIPTMGVVREENACSGQARQAPYTGEEKGFAWSVYDRQSHPKLGLSPNAQFKEYLFERE